MSSESLPPSDDSAENDSPLPPPHVPIYLVTDETDEERRREAAPLPDAPDGPFWEISRDEVSDDVPQDDEQPDTAPVPIPPAVSPKTAWIPKILIGVALLMRLNTFLAHPYCAAKAL